MPQIVGKSVLPLQTKQIKALHEALCKVPDPRARNRTLHIGSILAIIDGDTIWPTDTVNTVENALFDWHPGEDSNL